ncbi:hypothetical protein FQR65_LT06709 [Abscondita terminalis]|nr:hypothetical protein FQR65_LT06709 [Abscondita terminalis]
MPKLLEVCVDNLESALAAFAGGADRIELCSSLSEGGLTPTPGFLTQVQQANTKKVPVYCMLRCRSSNFVYTQEEIEIMVEDANMLKKRGADGRPTIEIEVIIDLGFKRVLTSGKQKTAQLGVKLITQLMEQVDDRIIIIPGGGVNKENLKFIMETTEAQEYHGSFRKVKTETKPEEQTEVTLGDNDGPLYLADELLITEAVHILRNE